MNRPVIGVTGPKRGGLIAWLMTALAIRRCGGKPVRITPARPLDKNQLDGVVIGGGTDVDPLQYGEFWQTDKTSDCERQRNSLLDWLVGLILTVFRTLFARRSSQDYDPDRDELEKYLIQHALYYDMPALGICRGAQLMNVVLGGTLHRNIEHFYTEETNNIRSILPRKSISVSSGSHLHRILQAESCRVNALHDQSIKGLGDNIVVSAKENTGVIQAIERSNHPFFLGVQWHPEYMPQSKTQQGLFHSLVACSRAKTNT